jgi:uncharacterized damage-inducible protein DinB
MSARRKGCESIPIVFVLVMVALPGLAAPAHAQAPARAGVLGELLQDVQSVEEKLISLAEAIPEAQYDWRPGVGVRSVGEVVMHVAADNWFLTTPVGVAAPAATGIKAGDYPSVQAYERRSANKQQAITELRNSFAHLRKAMADTPDARLDQKIDLFGTSTTVRGLWILTTTHMHEHLGQLIAYARSNGVVPPWSRAGS